MYDFQVVMALLPLRAFGLDDSYNADFFLLQNLSFQSERVKFSPCESPTLAFSFTTKHQGIYSSATTSNLFLERVTRARRSKLNLVNSL